MKPVFYLPATLAGLVAASSAGCKVGPEYKSPSARVPAAYISAKAFAEKSSAAGAKHASLARWWAVYNDPHLDSLVEEAAKANLDVRLAQARVREARALRGVARSGLFPEVNAGAGYSRSRASEHSQAGANAKAFGRPAETDLFTAGLDMSWEVDVFGGQRRALEAAHADVQAAEESQRETLITVLAEVGLNYLDLRGTQRQLAVARENLKAQEQTLALTRDRFRAGLSSELDVVRAQAQVATTRSGIPPLEDGVQRAIHRLGVLLGQLPEELSTILEEGAPIPGSAPGIPIGLPSDLLRRRPDIRRAEREIAAATARIGVATADLFPRFFITGAAGLQSVESGDLLDAGSRFWSLGPTFRWPIFNAGRIRQNIRVQDARQEQAAIRYEQSVLLALEEVENALVAFGKEQERYQSLAESETATRRAVALATERFKGGLVDFLSVLEAERSLLSIQDNLALSERALSQQMIRIYKALGGGWEIEGEKLASSR